MSPSCLQLVREVGKNVERQATTGYSAPQFLCFWAGDGQCCCLLLNQIRIHLEDKWSVSPNQKITSSLRNCDLGINTLQTRLWGTVKVRWEGGGKREEGESRTSFNSAALCLDTEPSCWQTNTLTTSYIFIYLNLKYQILWVLFQLISHARRQYLTHTEDMQHLCCVVIVLMFVHFSLYFLWERNCANINL